MGVGARTFEEFWELESKPGEDVAVVLDRMTQLVQAIPTPGRDAVIRAADTVSGLREAFRRVAWMAWLDGRLNADAPPKTATLPCCNPITPGQPVYVATDPADVKRRLAALGRVVSASKVLLARLTLDHLDHVKSEHLDLNGVDRAVRKIPDIVQRLDELTEDAAENSDELLSRIRNVAERVGRLEGSVSAQPRKHQERPTRKPRRPRAHGRK